MFGAQYTINIWFRMQQPQINISSIGGGDGSANNSNTSSGLPTRYLLLSSDSPPEASAASTAYDPSIGSFVIQAVRDVQAIVVLQARRLFPSVSEQDDYSFLNTSVVGAANTSGSSHNGTLVRHAVEANPRIAAYIDGQLAWGSPPVAEPVSKAPAGGP